MEGLIQLQIDSQLTISKGITNFKKTPKYRLTVAH